MRRKKSRTRQSRLEGTKMTCDNLTLEIGSTAEQQAIQTLMLLVL